VASGVEVFRRSIAPYNFDLRLASGDAFVTPRAPMPRTGTAKDVLQQFSRQRPPNNLRLDPGTKLIVREGHAM